jgi:hypothetical protein
MGIWRGDEMHDYPFIFTGYWGLADWEYSHLS